MTRLYKLAGWQILLSASLTCLANPWSAFAQTAAMPPSPKSLEGGIKTYVDITARIAKHVTPAHLAECKRLLETQSVGIGFTRKLLNPIAPNPVGTCAVAFRAFFQEPLQDRAVWGADATYTGGLLNTRKVGFASCVMRLENNKIVVDPDGPTVVNKHCLFLQNGLRPKS